MLLAEELPSEQGTWNVSSMGTEVVVMGAPPNG